jgi:hypothetical protein
MSKGVVSRVSSTRLLPGCPGTLITLGRADRLVGRLPGPAAVEKRGDTGLYAPLDLSQRRKRQARNTVTARSTPEAARILDLRPIPLPIRSAWSRRHRKTSRREPPKYRRVIERERAFRAVCDRRDGPRGRGQWAYRVTRGPTYPDRRLGISGRSAVISPPLSLGPRAAVPRRTSRALIRRQPKA